MENEKINNSHTGYFDISVGDHHSAGIIFTGIDILQNESDERNLRG